MTSEVDWELAARLTLHELLFEVQLAQSCAAAADGQRLLETFRDAILDRLLHRTSFGRVLTEQECEEWTLNARTLTERLFARAESRRSEIAAT